MKDDALRDSDRALALNQNDTVALEGKCELDIGTESFDAAISECTRAIALSSSVPRPYIFRAAAFGTQRRYALAEKDFTSAITLVPKPGALYAFRGRMYEEDGQLAEAKQDFEKASQTASDAPGLSMGRGLLDVLSGDNPGAIRDFTDAVAQDPTDASAIVWLEIAKFHIGHDNLEQLTAMQQKLKQTKWPAAVIDLYLGHETVDAVRKQSSTGSKEIATFQACEAEYYIGENYLRLG